MSPYTQNIPESSYCHRSPFIVYGAAPDFGPHDITDLCFSTLGFGFGRELLMFTHIFGLLYISGITMMSFENGQSSPSAMCTSLFNRLYPAVSTVKVYPVVTGQTCGADEAILRQLKKSVAVETSDLQDSDVIIVFCSVKSRVASDVDAAMRKDSVSSGNKPVILVVMHHTRDPNFSTGVTQWSEMYPNIKMITHILFHETQPGLLPNCPRNRQAIQQIQEELRSLT